VFRRNDFHTPTARRRLLAVCAAIVSLPLLFVASPLPAADHRASFDGPDPEWIVLKSATAPKAQQQYIATGELQREGAGAEFLRFGPASPSAQVELVFPVPATLRLDETRVSLWTRYSRPNLSIHLRLRFPKQIDPRTNKPLVAELPGDQYALTTSQWKKLECRPDDRSFALLMQRLRHQLSAQIKQADLDARDVYIEAVVLRAIVDENGADLLIDDLLLTPLVDLQTSSVTPEAEAAAATQFSRILVGDNRITKDTRPFFPLIMPYHHEPVEKFLEYGANVAWVERYDDPTLLNELASKDLSVTATPPRLERTVTSRRTDETEMEPGEEERGASLTPFTAATAPIDFWMLDVRIPGSALAEVSDWVDQIKDADYQHPRPILADVLGREREFHRQLSMLGSSKFTLHTNTSPRELSDYLALKQRMAMPGKSMFTFLQLEPPIETARSNSRGESPLRIEPEQLFMFGNMALSSGYKAIGYWNRNPIDDETAQALKLMNLHIRLLEPWLATGRVSGMAQVQFGPDRGAAKNGSKVPSVVSNRWDNGRPQTAGKATEFEQQIRATVIDGEFGMLVIVNWLDDQGQYQPGQMRVDDLHVFVKRDVMKAYVVTATDCTPATALKSIPGGTEITVRSLDQFAYILITHNQSVVDAVQKQIWQIREPAAKAWVALADAKLKRVHDVHRQIEFSAPSVMNASAILSNADRQLGDARRSLEHGYYKDAQDWVRLCLANTRVVQRKHWENAAARFSSPAAFPYAVSFQSLPEHWKMMSELGSDSPAVQPLLRTGRLGSLKQMEADGWVIQEAELPATVQTAVELRDNATAGQPCLRLAAATGAETQGMPVTDDALIQIVSPPMTAQKGQLVHITGKIRLPQAMHPSGDGLHIYSSLDGPGRGLRFRNPTPSGQWTTFEFVTEARQTGEFRLIFELRGLGDVYLDDLKVMAVSLQKNQIPEPKSQ
jgi:hypothetical protein